jgi:hypothetical protein
MKTAAALRIRTHMLIFPISTKVFEEEGPYFDRMVGYVSLYAAYVQLDTKGQPHPHGTSFGWKWIARLLNEKPRTSAACCLLSAVCYLLFAFCSLLSAVCRIYTIIEKPLSKYARTTLRY